MVLGLTGSSTEEIFLTATRQLVQIKHDNDNIVSKQQLEVRSWGKTTFLILQVQLDKVKSGKK